MLANPIARAFARRLSGNSLPEERAAGLMVPSAPFVVEYIDVAADSARCSDVKSSATQERVFSAERVCVEDERLKLHERMLKPPAVRICMWVSERRGPYRKLRQVIAMRMDSRRCDGVHRLWKFGDYYSMAATATRRFLLSLDRYLLFGTCE
jgi:hypothetical protein